MASCPITSWQIDGETMETVADLIFLKYHWNIAPISLQMVTAAMKLKDSCSLEDKLWQTYRQHIKKQRYYLPTKVHLVKAMVFPAVMYGCENWTVKKVEQWKIDAFELLWWRRLLIVPWMARSNQSILKEISPEYSLEGLMLKLKFQYFGHLMWRTDSLEKTLMLGKIEGGGEGTTEYEMVGWHHSLDGHEFEQVLGVGDGQGSLMCCSPWVAKSQTWLSDWTELKISRAREEARAQTQWKWP